MAYWQKLQAGQVSSPVPPKPVAEASAPERIRSELPSPSAPSSQAAAPTSPSLADYFDDEEEEILAAKKRREAPAFPHHEEDDLLEETRGLLASSTFFPPQDEGPEEDLEQDDNLTTGWEDDDQFTFSEEAKASPEPQEAEAPQHVRHLWDDDPTEDEEWEDPSWSEEGSSPSSPPGTEHGQEGSPSPENLLEDDNDEEEPAEEEEASPKQGRLSGLLARRGKRSTPPEEAEEDSAEEAPVKKPKASFREKLEELKAQARAELAGKDAPPAKKKAQEAAAEALDEADEADEDSEGDEPTTEAAPTGSKRRGGASKAPRGRSLPKVLSAPLNLLKRLYLAIVGFFFGVVEGLLKLLAKLPLVGRLFSWMLKFTRVLKVVALSIPLMVVLAVVLLVYSSAPALTSSLELPDEGKVGLSAMSYQRDSNEVTATVKNEGNVLATVTPTFTVYTSSWYDPRTWRSPRASLTCPGKPLLLEMDQAKVVKVKCPATPGGFGSAVSGSLSE